MPHSLARFVLGAFAMLVVFGDSVLRPAGAETLTGAAAYGDWRTDAPGVTRRITSADLPKAFATRSAGNGPRVVAATEGDAPRVPPGFTVSRFAEGLDNPRIIRTAPNGDVFVAETGAGRIRVFRAKDGAARPESKEIFLDRLDSPFGLAFYPAKDPQWLYVANTNSVQRIPYRAGDLKARGPAETVVAQLSPDENGHSTRDVAFTPDGARMLVSIGSASNVAEGLPRRSAEAIGGLEARSGVGALWAGETNRATVVSYTPDGKDPRPFANGIRNCVGLAIQPGVGDAWCATNERDGLGDDLPPDYVSRIRAGGFYGWPWYYTGAHEDPRHPGERPDLAEKTITPDVLIQPHSAPLQMAFYDPPAGASGAFPPEWGGAFASLHGSWNRAKRTGYKVVRIVLKDGKPTGEYQDFLVGFIRDDRSVWGRPVGVTTAHDGALLVTEDAGGTVWRVAWTGN